MRAGHVRWPWQAVLGMDCHIRAGHLAADRAGGRPGLRPGHVPHEGARLHGGLLREEPEAV